MRAAVIDFQTNIVVNLVVADEDSTPPDGCVLVNVDDKWCDMGALYDPASNTFTDPEASTLPEPVA